ncbi:MAG: Hpt domain-containing protein [Bacteroidota bacterium]|nr:Hpt domain-containing protein [Bacteroidota bacterium]
MFDELKKLFIQEVTELLEKTEKNLLILETDNTDKNAMHEVFRSMHTIKGSAGVYGLNKTVNLAHDFENIFSKIKENNLSTTNKIISLALKAKDIILKLVEAKSEDDIPDNELFEINDEIKQIIDEISSDKIEVKSKNDSDTKKYKSYYILFEPNDDFFDRNLKIEDILSDFNSFQFKIITKIKDNNRKGKLNELYEIIVATDYKVDDLEAIFLFASEEVIFNEIISTNIFSNSDFINFYDNAIKILPFSEQRFELIKKYGDNISPDSSEKEAETQKLDEIIDKNQNLVGVEDIKITNEKKHQQIQYIKIPAQKLDDLLNRVSELIINNSQLRESIINNKTENLLKLSEDITKITNEIKEDTLNLRLIPVKSIIPPYRRIIFLYIKGEPHTVNIVNRVL